MERHELLEERQQNIVVCQRGRDPHDQAPREAAKQRGLFGLVEAIDRPGRQNEGGTHEEVCQFPHAAGSRGTQLQSVLDQLDQNAPQRPVRKGADERGQIGEIHPGKGRRQGYREFQKGQHKGHCGEHRGTDKGAELAVGLFHEDYLLSAEGKNALTGQTRSERFALLPSRL